MAAKESRYPKDWVTKAEADLRAAERLLEGEDLDIAAFHVQQAIEKLLKGFLLRQGWQLRRIHELEALLNEAVTYDATLERYRELCTVATEYYIAERYPYEEAVSVTREQLAQQLAETKTLWERVRKTLEI